MTTLTLRFDQALAFASYLHRHPVRTGTTIPCVSYRVAVCGILLETDSAAEAAIGAIQQAAEDPGGKATLGLIREMYSKLTTCVLADYKELS